MNSLNEKLNVRTSVIEIEELLRDVRELNEQYHDLQHQYAEARRAWMYEAKQVDSLLKCNLEALCAMLHRAPYTALKVLGVSSAGSLFPKEQLDHVLSFCAHRNSVNGPLYRQVYVDNVSAYSASHAYLKNCDVTYEVISRVALSSALAVKGQAL
jgi:hypothetical protein